MEKDLDFIFRMFDNKLTQEEQEEIKRLDAERDKKPKSNNPFCAFGGDLEGEEIFSIDTH